MGTEVATNEKNPYEQYYEESAASLVPFLKFVKGEFLFGRDETELPLGHKLAVGMEHMQVGWQAWNDKEPIDAAFVLVSSGQPQPKRGDLRDYPPRLDKDGKEQDAWQGSTMVPMRSVEDGVEFLFTSSSKGGRNALAALAGQFGKAMRQHPGQWPVVELCRDSYKHDDYGKVFVPLFKIVNWATEAELIELFGPGVGDGGDGSTTVETHDPETGEIKEAPKALSGPREVKTEPDDKPKDAPKRTTRF